MGQPNWRQCRRNRSLRTVWVNLSRSASDRRWHVENIQFLMAQSQRQLKMRPKKALASLLAPYEPSSAADQVDSGQTHGQAKALWGQSGDPTRRLHCPDLIGVNRGGVFQGRAGHRMARSARRQRVATGLGWTGPAAALTGIHLACSSCLSPPSPKPSIKIKKFMAFTGFI